MPSEIYLVKVGMSMTEGSVEEWFVPDGGTVEAGELLYRLETEKINMDVDTDVGGIVKHGVAPGVPCKPGDVIGWIYAPDEEIPDTLPTAGAGAAAAEVPAATAPAPDTGARPQAKPQAAAGSTRQRTNVAGKPLPGTPPEVCPPEGDAATRLQWLRERVENCPVCNEHLSADGKVVFGEGAPEADILFCGEAPGADEEVSGRPFVGKAGQLLDKILKAMGLEREQVYIANILKWRPEHTQPYGNRPPTQEEMRFCLPYVRAQIDIIRPKVIVALGKTAVDGLLGHDPARRMGGIRGTWREFQSIPLMITFHPSYVLRNGTNATKRKIWEDMLAVMEAAGLPVSEKQRNFFRE